MVFQFINLGEQPGGAGGDTNRSANVKCNENFAELYISAEKASVELAKLQNAAKWLDDHKASTGINLDISELAGLRVPLSIAQGGTGAHGPLEACRSIKAVALGSISQSYGTELENNQMPALAAIASEERLLTLYNGGNKYASVAITFHRGGEFACHFGLDTDNQLKVGGWSFGPNAYRIYHEGNTTRAADGTLKAI